MTTITRRTALAVPITLPLLPVSAYAAPAESSLTPLGELLENLEKLPPDSRDLVIRIAHMLAENNRKRMAGMAS